MASIHITLPSFTLEQWGIIYGIVVSSGGIVWQFFQWRRARPKIRVVVGLALRRSVKPGTTDGFQDRAYLMIEVKNMGGVAITVESWGTEGYRPKKPFVIMQPDNLPAKLDPYEHVRFEVENLDVFLRKPKRLYVRDSAERHWHASRKQIRKAIDEAEQVAKLNASRVDGVIPPTATGQVKTESAP